MPKPTSVPRSGVPLAVPLATGCLCVALLFSGCGDSNYTKAGIGTAAAVGMAGVHRAITNGCWATCSPGYVCNQESGICEPGECLPACSAGQQCVRTPSGKLSCARDPGAFRPSSAAPATPGPSDAGTTAAGGSSNADAAARDAG